MYTEREQVTRYSLICTADHFYGFEMKMNEYATKKEAEKYKLKAERQFLTRKNIYNFRYEVRPV